MIEYQVGNLFANINTNPKPGPVFIPHIVNNEKRWGSGFVVPLGERWPVAREVYLNHPGRLILGETQIVHVDAGIYVCNMVAQNSVVSPNNPKPIKYAALTKCMQRVELALRAGGVVHAPQFGSLRAGGNWDFIEELIEEIWGDYPVTIYKYEENVQNPNS